MPVGAMIYTPGMDPAFSGTRPPCTSTILRYRRGLIIAIQPTRLHLLVNIAAVAASVVAAQEQWLFMINGAVASTSRDDGGHCGAKPPCTFRYAPSSPFMRGHKKQTSLEAAGRSAVASPPRVRTTLCEIEELRMPNYAMRLPSLFCAPAADRWRLC